MVNKLINAISIKLNQVFGDGYNIYTESVKQGFKEPCFFIKILNPTQNQVIGSRYFREHPFDIHFFPSVESNEEMIGVAEQLFDTLEYITLENGDLVHGTKMDYEIVDGILHFFVNFDIFVRKIDVPADNMETLQVESDVKG